MYVYGVEITQSERVVGDYDCASKSTLYYFFLLPWSVYFFASFRREREERWMRMWMGNDDIRECPGFVYNDVYAV